MRCAKAERLISDFIDGNLASREKARLQEHLDACPDCAKLLKDFQGIVAGAGELEEFSPSPQVWLKIKERLQPGEQKILSYQPRKKTWFELKHASPKFKYAVIAALLLGFVVSAVAVWLLYWRGEDVLRAMNSKEYAIAKLDEAERHYQQAIKALMEAVSAEEGTLDPQMALVFKANLQVLDASITVFKQTVLQEPESIETRNFLLIAYREKLEFLQEMMEVQKQSSPKRDTRKI